MQYILRYEEIAIVSHLLVGKPNQMPSCKSIKYTPILTYACISLRRINVIHVGLVADLSSVIVTRACCHMNQYLRKVLLGKGLLCYILVNIYFIFIAISRCDGRWKSRSVHDFTTWVPASRMQPAQMYSCTDIRAFAT